MGKVIVVITSELVVEMVTKGWNIGKESIIECIEGVPEDAKLIKAQISNIWNRYYPELEFTFEHESFVNIEGEPLPYLHVIHQTTMI